MPHNSTITVIIPALNEAENIASAIETALVIIPQYFKAWEILVFNDGSKDDTGLIAEQFAIRNSTVRVIHHDTPKNLGGCYKEGVQLATMEYVIMIPGDNEASPSMLHSIFAVVGSADMIIPYTNNTQVRPWIRRALSTLFSQLLNTLSGANLKYYNGTVLHRTALIQSTPIITNSFGYQAEALVYLLKQKCSYREIGTPINYRAAGKSKAFNPSNLIETGKFLFRLANQKPVSHL